MIFKAGPRLQFLFHSDSSNNEWGYKFTVTAYGLPDVAVSWALDLQLLVCRLMGRLAAQCMALKSAHRESQARWLHTRAGWRRVQGALAGPVHQTLHCVCSALLP